MRVLLDIKDSEAVHLMRVLRSLPYVKELNISAENEELVDELESADTLTTKDVALGIGRRFTEQELTEYLTRTAGDEPKTASAVKRSLKKRIAERISIK
jgi:hypothetical protein